MPNRFLTIFVSVLLALISVQTKAQQSNLELSWRAGTVVLTSGDTIKGSLIYTLGNDLIRVTQADGTVSAFTPVNVISFEVQDNLNRKGLFSGSAAATFNSRRTYISLPWNHNKDYSNFKSPAFFVLLQSGKYSLLMRENREILRDPATSIYNSGSRTTRDVINQDFYLLTSDQNIVRLSNPKSDILRIFGKQQKQISAYARENRLSFTDAAELAQIVSYANTLIP